tara:strand:+ start:105 stop:458 length:354 start_codon:yes stop_codon:yes gene_type:complete
MQDALRYIPFVRSFVLNALDEGWATTTLIDQLILWAEGIRDHRLHDDTLAFLSGIDDPASAGTLILRLLPSDGVEDAEPADATTFFTPKTVADHHEMNVEWWKNNDPMCNVSTACRS